MKGKITFSVRISVKVDIHVTARALSFYFLWDTFDGATFSL